MNKTFKVVFNKARGALMVVNEVTSSIQAKGTKTVMVAALAGALVGGAGLVHAEESALVSNDNVTEGYSGQYYLTGDTTLVSGRTDGNVRILNGATVDIKNYDPELPGVPSTQISSELDVQITL